MRENLGREMCEFYREVGIFAAAEPVLGVVDRLEWLELRWVHPMPGGSLPGEVVPEYTRALRENAFAFDGRIFGRRVPGQA